MPFNTGNSGNFLRDCVIKVGEGCREEGAFCQHLGPTVAPEILAMIPNGYCMERLKPAPITHSTLLQIEELLEKEVWSRPALPISIDNHWSVELKKFGVEVPTWVKISEPCLAHGDPTVSNFMVRTTYRMGQPILIDPRAPRSYIPQCRETDMGRILQSLMGWEVVAYAYEPIPYFYPKFHDNPNLLKQAMFWCGAAAARIEYLERSRAKRRHILDWCQKTRGICFNV